MKFNLQHIGFKDMLTHKLWRVVLFMSLFVSSGFVGDSYQQQPRIVQTEWIISKRPLSKKTLYYPFFTINDDKTTCFCCPKNYKNLIAQHDAATKRLLDNRLNVVLSFKNNSPFFYWINASRNAKEVAA